MRNKRASTQSLKDSCTHLFMNNNVLCIECSLSSSPKRGLEQTMNYLLLERLLKSPYPRLNVS